MNGWTDENINHLFKFLIQELFELMRSNNQIGLTCDCESSLFKLYRDKFQQVTTEIHNEPELQNLIHAIEIKDESLIKRELIKIIKLIRVKEIDKLANIIKDNPKAYFSRNESHFY